MSGEATPVQIGAFLTALRLRGETVDEIAGAVATMRAKMTPVEAPADAIDVVGTGGDASGSYNISTDLGLRRRRRRRAGRQARQPRAVVEIRRRRHADRPRRQDRPRRRSRSPPASARPVSASCSRRPIMRRCGMSARPAPSSASARSSISSARCPIRPASSATCSASSRPTGSSRSPMCWAASAPRRAWVVHGDGGLDEMSPAGETKVAVLKDGKVTAFKVTPEDAGLKRAGRGDQGRRRRPQRRGAERGARTAEPSAYRDTVLLNAGAALVVAGKAEDLERRRGARRRDHRRGQGRRPARPAGRGFERLSR